MADNENTIELGIGIGDTASVLSNLETRLNAVFKGMESIVGALDTFGSRGADQVRILVKNFEELKALSKLNPALLTPYVSEIERAAAATSKLAALNKEINLQDSRSGKSLKSALRSDDPDKVQAGLRGNQRNIDEARLKSLETFNAGIRATGKELLQNKRAVLAADKLLEKSLATQVKLQERLAELNELGRVAKVADNYNRVQPGNAAIRAATPRGVEEAARAKIADQAKLDKLQEEYDAAQAKAEDRRKDRLVRRAQAQLPQAVGTRSVDQAAIRAGGTNFLSSNPALFDSLVQSKGETRTFNEAVSQAMGPTPIQTRTGEVGEARTIDAQLNAVRAREIEDAKVHQGQLNALRIREIEDAKVHDAQLKALRGNEIADAKVYDGLLKTLRAGEISDARVYDSQLKAIRAGLISDAKVVDRGLDKGRTYDVSDAKAVDAQLNAERTRELADARAHNAQLNAIRASEIADAKAYNAQLNAVRASELADAKALDREIKAELASRPENMASRTVAGAMARGAAANALGTSPEAVAQLAKAKDDLAALNEQVRVQRQAMSIEDKARANNRRQDDKAALDKEQLRQRVEAGQGPQDGPAPRSQKEVMQDARQRRNEYITGDGGANLLTTQAYIQTNYLALDAVLRGFKAGVTAVLDFDKALKNLQAVTGTTDGELLGLETTLLSISSASTFSATELAKAGELLAKDGFSLKEIVSILQATSVLATSTGTTLEKSTELLSGVFTTFNVQASESNKVLDQTFVTLNSSRLSVDKYKNSLADAGVAAKENGVTLAEFNAGLQTLSNAGLTSGAQLNQGYRQVISTLAEPTAKLTKRLDELGIALTDIDVKSNGFEGVFTNLSKAGFTAADAFAVLNPRVATTFATFLNNTDAFKGYYQTQLLATGAAEAQAKALTSVIDQAGILGNTFTALAVKSSGPLKGAILELLGGMNAVAGAAGKGGVAVTILTTTLASLAVVATGSRLLAMTRGMYDLSTAGKVTTSAMQVYRSVMGSVAVVEGEATVSTITLGAALRGLGMALLPLGIVTAVIGGLYAMSEMSTTAADNAIRLKEAETKLRENLEDKSKSVEKLNTFMERLSTQSVDLKSDNDKLANAVSEARNQFGNLSLGMQGNIQDFDTLIGKLVNLRTELRAATGIELLALNSVLREKAADATKQINAASGSVGLRSIATQLGASNTNVATVYGDSGATLPLNTDSENSQFIQKKLGNKTLGKEYTDYINSPDKTLLGAQELISKITAGSQTGVMGLNAQGIPTLQKPTISEADAKTLIDAIRALAGGLQTQAASAVGTGNNDQKIRRQDLATSFGREGLNNNLVNLTGLVQNPKQLESIKGGDARTAALAELQKNFDAQAKGIEGFMSKLSAGDKKEFLSTEEGTAYQQLKTKLNLEISPAVSAYVEKEAGVIVDAQVTALKANLGKVEKEIGQTKDPKIAAALAEHARAMALALRDAELRQVNERVANNKKTALYGPETEALVTGNLRDAVQSNYERNVDGINSSLNRVEGRRGPINADRPIKDSVNDYAGDISKEESASAKQLRTALAVAQRPLKSQEAFINAASKSGEFSKTTIEVKEKELNDLKIAAADASIKDYLKNISALVSFRKKANDDLTMVNQDIADIYDKYGLKVDADGNIEGGETKFGIGPEAERKRKEEIAILTKLLAQRKALGQLTGDDGNSGTIGDKIDSNQEKVDTLTSEKNARSSKSDFSTSGGFNDAVKGFSIKNHLDDSAMKQYTDSLTSLFEKMNSSFSTFIENFVSGNLKGKNAFKDFATSIIKDALKIASEKASSAILGQVFSLAGSALGSMFGGGIEAPGSTNTNSYGPSNPNTFGAYQGGIVPRFDQGGIIEGTHIGRDNVHALLAPGEAILNRSAVGLVGNDMIDRMNSGAIRQQQSLPTLPGPRAPDLVNVYVVDKNTTPQLGKKDVLAAVGEDILAGGATKKLIKQVALGQM